MADAQHPGRAAAGRRPADRVRGQDRQRRHLPRHAARRLHGDRRPPAEPAPRRGADARPRGVRRPVPRVATARRVAAAQLDAGADRPAQQRDRRPGRLPRRRARPRRGGRRPARGHGVADAAAAAARHVGAGGRPADRAAAGRARRRRPRARAAPVVRRGAAPGVVRARRHRLRAQRDRGRRPRGPRPAAARAAAGRAEHRADARADGDVRARPPARAHRGRLGAAAGPPRRAGAGVGVGERHVARAAAGRRRGRAAAAARRQQRPAGDVLDDARAAGARVRARVGEAVDAGLVRAHRGARRPHLVVAGDGADAGVPRGRAVGPVAARRRRAVGAAGARRGAADDRAARVVGRAAGGGARRRPGGGAAGGGRAGARRPVALSGSPAPSPSPEGVAD